MTGNAPPICSAFWGISPISVVALMKVVGISNVPTFIFAACLKPKPMTVSGMGGEFGSSRTSAVVG